MYVFACSATVVLTVLVMAMALKAPSNLRHVRILNVSGGRLTLEVVRWAVGVFSGGAVASRLPEYFCVFNNSTDGASRLFRRSYMQAVEISAARAIPTFARCPRRCLARLVAAVARATCGLLGDESDALRAPPTFRAPVDMDCQREPAHRSICHR